MRLRNLRARQIRRYTGTTKRDKANPVTPNLLKRDLTADRPDRVRPAPFQSASVYESGEQAEGGSRICAYV